MGNSLEIQWLRLHTSPEGSMGSIPGQGGKIQYAAWQVQKKVSGVMEIFFILFGVAILVVQVYVCKKSSSNFKFKI